MHTITVYPERNPTLEEIKGFVRSFSDGEWVTASRGVIESEEARAYLDYDDHYREYFDKYLDEQQRAELTARLGFAPRLALHVHASNAYLHSRQLVQAICEALVRQWGGGWGDGVNRAIKATDVQGHAESENRCQEHSKTRNMANRFLTSSSHREFPMSATIDEMIQKFQFYVLDRQIGLAELLGQHFEDRNDATPFKQSGYVILSVAAAYFEMIQQFIDGKESVEIDATGKMRSHSWDFFKRGFKEVYPDPQWTDAAIQKIYKVVRCGMYHGGMPKIGCHLSRYFRPGFHLCRNEIHINPAAVVREIRCHFERYINSLRIDPTRRDNFESMCKLVGIDQTPPNHTYCDTPGGTILTATTPAPGAKGDEPIRIPVETEQ